MSLLLLLWLGAAFTACGVGAWLAMAGVILGMVDMEPLDDVITRPTQALLGAILAFLGLVFFAVAIAMIARVLG
jgi:hypothetical protein